MGAKDHWERLRDVDAARIVKFLGRNKQRRLEKRDIAEYLGVGVERAGRLIEHINHPDSAFKPVRYTVAGGWVVVSFDANAEAMIEFEDHARRTQLGVSDSRRTNVVLSDEWLGSDHPVTQKVEARVLGVSTVDVGTREPSR